MKRKLGLGVPGVSRVGGPRLCFASADFGSV